MGKRKIYEEILSDLKSSQNEEEVVGNITKIVKSFSSDYYKNDLYENPYFKSFLPEVKEIVMSELEEIKSSLREEIRAIEEEISKLNKKGIISESTSKLKDLKKDCVILIKELDDRLEDLEFL